MDINTCSVLAASIGDIRSLALYANVVPALTSLILAAFVYRKATDRPKAVLFIGFVLIFSLWLVSNAIIWTSNNYYLIAGFWSSMAFLEPLFFLMLFCFFYLEVYSKIPLSVSIGVLAATVAPFVINVLGQSTELFDLAWCNMSNNEFLNIYNLYLELIVLLLIFALGCYRYLKVRGKSHAETVRVLIVTAAIVFFMGIFSGSVYISSIGTGIYFAELYALFTLPIFILLLTISVTSYGTFRLGDAVAQALFYIFVVFSGAQFFFVTSRASFALTTIAFLMTLSFGVLLLRSYRREVEAHQEIENLARALEETNGRQETLIHFIGHEVKGFLTKDAGAFAALLDGDFGAVPDTAKPFVTSALQQSRAGADSVANILKASNLKKGTVTYEKKPFDTKELVAGAVERAKQMAAEKKLELTLEVAEGNYQMVGDGPQINDHVLRNLIENAINYTPSGSVRVSLRREGQKVVFAVKDSGVGITDEDKKRLFTEGGHGAESQKVNAHSTGYGLYIAKQITDAHGGSIRAESEGAGKGSTFTAEFPAA